MKLTVTLFAGLGLLLSVGAEAAKYKAPPGIVATLPKYCWGQYVDGFAGKPGYGIEGCGAAANHFCPGLVQIAQARTEPSLSERKGLLRSARVNMEYTLSNTEKYPACFLRKEAQMQIQIIDIRARLAK